MRRLAMRAVAIVATTATRRRGAGTTAPLAFGNVGGVERMIDVDRNRLANGPLDIAQKGALF